MDLEQVWPIKQIAIASKKGYFYYLDKDKEIEPSEVDQTVSHYKLAKINTNTIKCIGTPLIMKTALEAIKKGTVPIIPNSIQVIMNSKKQEEEQDTEMMQMYTENIQKIQANINKIKELDNGKYVNIKTGNLVAGPTNGKKGNATYYYYTNKKLPLAVSKNIPNIDSEKLLQFFVTKLSESYNTTTKASTIGLKTDYNKTFTYTNSILDLKEEGSPDITHLLKTKLLNYNKNFSTSREKINIVLKEIKETNPENAIIQVDHILPQHKENSSYDFVESPTFSEDNSSDSDIASYGDELYE